MKHDLEDMLEIIRRMEQRIIHLERAVESITSRQNTKERDRCVHSKSLTWMKCSCAVPMTGAPVWSQITTNARIQF